MSKITFEEAAAKAIEFRNDRDWKQFHNPKDLAISVSLEASELLSSSSGPALISRPPGRSLK